MSKETLRYSLIYTLAVSYPYQWPGNEVIIHSIVSLVPMRFLPSVFAKRRFSHMHDIR